MSNAIVGTILEAFDVEMAKLMISNEPSSDIVGEKMLTEYLLSNCHVFFTPVNLHNLTDAVLSTVPLRDFVLELTDRVTVTLALQDLSLEDFIFSISKAIGYARNPKDGGLMVNEVLDSISIDVDLLSNMLQDNPWLIIMYVLKMYMHGTEYYKTSLEKMDSV